MQNPPEAVKGTAFEALAGKVTKEQALGMLRDSKVYTVRSGSDAFLRYFGNHCTGIGNLDLDADDLYDVWYLNTWNMERALLLENVSGHVEVKLPGIEGMALLALKKH